MRAVWVPASAITAVLIVAATGLSGCGGPAPVDPPRQFSSVGGSPFASGPGSLWLERVAPDAAVDPRSSAYVARLSGLAPVLAVRDSTVPVYAAEANSPRYTVAPTEPYTEPIRALTDVPIPDQAMAGADQDDHMVVVDGTEGCVFDFYRARRAGDGWTAEWVNATPVEGNGVYPDGLGTRASGFSAAAGLVWPEELRRDRIGHALVFTYPFTRRSEFVGRATATNGRATDTTALPMGARLVLDRSVDLDSLALDPTERTIARALQDHGMVLGDTGGEGITLYAPHPKGFAADPYASLLGDQPYVSLARIPFDKMRVLELGPPQPRYTGRAIDNRCTEPRRP